MVKIAVIGGGLMGAKIAGEMMYHGHHVKIHDQNMETLNSIHDRIEEDKRQLHEDGLISLKNVNGQLLCMSRLDETVRDADVVFEVVNEDLASKQMLFDQLSDYCKPTAILATNTLRLDVNQIVDNVNNRERTLGIRFLYPVYYIPEVEITPGADTSSHVIEKVRKILEKMGKTLFFRSGGEPLILTEDQKHERKTAQFEQMKNSAGLNHTMPFVPGLAHKGDKQTTQDYDDCYGPTSTDYEQDCAICMDNKRNCLLCPCHHMVTCTGCADSLLRRRDSCPICRKEIKETIKVFHS